MKNCPFCSKDNISAKIIYEDDTSFAFFDRDPISEGHILLVPREHYKDADEMPDELTSHIALVSKKIISAVKKVYGPDGYTVMQNGGKFNDVGHYHLHIIPRYEGDGFGWTQKDGAKLPSAETAERLSELCR